MTLKSYLLKQDNVAPHPPPYNFILFELDFDVKFPLLRLLLFLSDLKSAIFWINWIRNVTLTTCIRRYDSATETDVIIPDIEMLLAQ